MSTMPSSSPCVTATMVSESPPSAPRWSLANTLTVWAWPPCGTLITSGLANGGRRGSATAVTVMETVLVAVKNSGGGDGGGGNGGSSITVTFGSLSSASRLLSKKPSGG